MVVNKFFLFWYLKLNKGKNTIAIDYDKDTNNDYCFSINRDEKKKKKWKDR